MNKRYNKLDIIVSAVALALIVIASAVLGALQLGGVLNLEVNPFLLIFTVLTLGSGVYLTVFALIKKGGYELAVATLLNVIGAVLLLVALKVYVWIIVIVAVAILALGFLAFFVLKAGSLVVERTNEQENFVPYTEKLKQEKQKEKEEEKDLPEIKSFKD